MCTCICICICICTCMCICICICTCIRHVYVYVCAYVYVYVRVQLFEPAKIKTAQLKGIGILGKHQGPSLNVWLNQKEIDQMASQLHMLNHTVSGKNMEKNFKKELKFPPRELIMRGKAQWDNDIPKLTEPRMFDYPKWYDEMNNGIGNNKIKDAVLLKCTVCEKLDPDYVVKPDIFV